MAVNCRVIKRGYCDIIQAYGVNGHLGVDLSNPIDKILAHSDGVVCMVQTGQVNNHNSTGNGTYGNFIKIDHGNGAFTLYAHLSEVYVGLGQQVKQGQEIGLMGDSGNAYGAHLHFEVWKNNARTNPADYLDRDLFLAVTPCVARDETQNQILVNVDNLNVRTGADIGCSIVGQAVLNGIYNFSDTIYSGGYNWYKIADNQWIANAGDWCTVYSKKDSEGEKVINELNEQINELKEQINSLNKDISSLNEANQLLEQENAKLKEEKNSLKIFSVPETGYYALYLLKDESLKYKRS